MDEEVKVLLQVWGLGEYVEIFTDNKIDINCLSLLDASFAKELIAPLGDRVKFLKNLENFKKTLPETNLTSDENDNISMTEDFSVKFVDQLSEKHRRVVPLEEVINIYKHENESDITYCSSTPKETTPRSSPAPGCSDTQTTVTTSLHLEELLNSTAEGKSIINAHSANGLLSSSQRRKLSNIIIKHLIGADPEKRVESKTLMDYAQQIKLLFSKEIVSTYFIPYINNSNLKIKRCAKGKLYDCLQNRRRDYRDRRTRTPDQSAPSTSNESANEGEDLNEDINFLKNSCEPWHLVEEKWHSTVEFRLKQLHESQMTVAQYMNLYPALKKSSGYHLLQDDFKHIHPNYQNNFLESFQLHKNKLLDLLLKKQQRSQDSTIQEILNNCIEHQKETDNVKSQEATSIYTLTLLALTLAQPQSKNKKATWRPSRIESQDGFITHITRPMDLMETINRRRDKFAKLGVTLQPFILIVGPNAADIKTYYVVINETFYMVHSILEAVDACYKCIFSLQCNYPQESCAVWLFIQRAFYKMKTPWDKEFVAVNTLLSDFS